MTFVVVVMFVVVLMLVMMRTALLFVMMMMNVCHNFVRFYLFPGAKLRHTPCNLVAKLLFALRKYILR